MTRAALSAQNRAEVLGPVVRIAEFVELAFPGGTIRVTTADRNITWGGFTYVSNPVLTQHASVTENSDLKARGFSLQFSGLDAGLVDRILQDNYHYARVQLWIGFFDESWSLVADPYPLVDEQLMSSASISYESGSGVVEINAESWDLFGRRDSAVLATPESQRLRYAGDTGMDRVSIIPTEEVEWGGSYQRA